MKNIELRRTFEAVDGLPRYTLRWGRWASTRSLTASMTREDAIARVRRCLGLVMGVKTPSDAAVESLLRTGRFECTAGFVEFVEGGPVDRDDVDYVVDGSKYDDPRPHRVVVDAPRRDDSFDAVRPSLSAAVLYAMSIIALAASETGADVEASILSPQGFTAFDGAVVRVVPA